eukprot:gnl/Spiro4/26792_TR13312_c0_g1_i1.p1 gnl/Spiro4/26792_TR13312_c0_g1~~gnl/Spiro4/26792_TR13312_c0_g1_i1.p1  ORF type:complete len:328 (+),score=100.37 gnl/Spiro4/26792_TR13312_c0_g1_i1:73-1056(+)
MSDSEPDSFVSSPPSSDSSSFEDEKPKAAQRRKPAAPKRPAEKPAAARPAAKRKSNDTKPKSQPRRRKVSDGRDSEDEDSFLFKEETLHYDADADADRDDADDGDADDDPKKGDSKAGAEPKKRGPRAVVRSEMPLLSGGSASSAILIQVETPDNMAGDMGAVGRLKVQNDENILLDLKGTIYSGELVPCHTLLVVKMQGDKAKVEACHQAFVQLKRIKNIFDSEVVTEGEVEGMFDDPDDDINAAVYAAAQEEADGDDGESKPSKSKGKGKKSSKPGKPSKAGRPKGKETGKRKAPKGSSKPSGAKRPRTKDPAKPKKTAARKPAQ